MDASLLFLAAGEAQRLGQPKHLYPVRGRPWIEWQLEHAAALGFRHVVVVLGPVHHENFQKPVKLSLEIVRNPDPSRGPFSSLQTGLTKITGDLWMTPIDTPLPPPEVIETLTEVAAPGDFVRVPTFGGRGGHPVWLSSSWLRDLKKLDPTAPNARLDRLIHELPPDKVRRLEVPSDAILRNLNTPEDFAIL